MIAAELYEKTWVEYLFLPPSSRQLLRKYCKEHQVNYRGFTYWMQEKKSFFASILKTVKPSM
jgi:hypothetical protein